jgi:hypothetical protein
MGRHYGPCLPQVPLSSTRHHLVALITRGSWVPILGSPYPNDCTPGRCPSRFHPFLYRRRAGVEFSATSSLYQPAR